MSEDKKHQAPRRRINTKTAKSLTPREQDLYHWVLTADMVPKWVPKGTDPSELRRTVWPYNEVTKNIICQFVMEGKTLKEIGKIKGMPPAHTIYYWIRKYPEFKQELEVAKELRAEHFHDKAIEVAEKSKKNTILQDKLKVNTYKWAAQVNNPKNFSGKPPEQKENNRPIAIVINTGIERDDVPAIEVDGKEIKEE